MDGITKKPAGDDATYQEMMKNKEELRRKLQEQLQEAEWEFKKKMALLVGIIFLSGAITGGAVYGYFKSRSGGDTNTDE